MTDLTDDTQADFELALHITVTVPASLIPADWYEQNVPKRLYNWPEALTGALHQAMREYMADNEMVEFDQATWLNPDGPELSPASN